jgi:hypothetical protein
MSPNWSEMRYLEGKEFQMNPYCFESILITVSPGMGLCPGTLGHLERRDDRLSPVFQREICASGDASGARKGAGKAPFSLRSKRVTHISLQPGN